MVSQERPAMGVPALPSAQQERSNPSPTWEVLAQWPRQQVQGGLRPVGLVLGQLASVTCPGFPSAFFRLPVSGVSCPRRGTGSGKMPQRSWAPLSLPGVSSSLARALAVASLSSQLSWWLQLPGSANTHPLLSPPTHPSPASRADHGSQMLLISKLGFPGKTMLKRIHLPMQDK